MNADQLHQIFQDAGSFVAPVEMTEDGASIFTAIIAVQIQLKRIADLIESASKG